MKTLITDSIYFDENIKSNKRLENDIDDIDDIDEFCDELEKLISGEDMILY